MHFETADLKGIVTRTKELILPKGVIEKKAEESGVLSKNFHVYFSIKFHEIKLSVRRCQANPTQNSKKMLNDSFFLLYENSLEENATNFVQLCLYLICKAQKLMERHKYCPPPSIIISEMCTPRE